MPAAARHGQPGGEEMHGSELAPGALVRHPARPDWGIGQVQSAIGGRATVNFEHAGKRIVDTGRVALEPVAATGER